jgi:hypothetical protein
VSVVEKDPLSTSIQLSSGAVLNLLAPDPGMMSIEVIAHATSNICRFNGHVNEFYSVAQHCVLVSDILEYHLDCGYFAVDGLMHDATEAFVGDVASPLKRLIADTYVPIEDSFHRALAQRYGIRFPLPDIVKRADLLALGIERRDLGLAGNDGFWPEMNGIPENVRIDEALPPREAEAEFIIRAHDLMGGSE